MSSAGDFIIENGVLTEYVGPGGDVVIPESVTGIGDSAFWRCDPLRTLVTPEGLRSIGKEAFFRCEGLELVSLPDSLESCGKDAFFGCSCVIRIRHWPDALSKGISGKEDILIETEDDLERLPAKCRAQALVGFVSGQDRGLNDSAGSYLDYAKKNVGKLLKRSFDCPQLLTYLCEKQLIPANKLDAFLAEAEARGDVGQKAMLLQYRNEQSEEYAKHAAKREKKQEEYLDERVFRQIARDQEEGLKGLTFVITGDLENWSSRKEAQAYLQGYGAKLGTAVNQKTDYLVAGKGKDTSKKREEAEALGVEVISEERFNAMAARRYLNAPSVAIPGWVTSIPSGAFQSCGDLEQVLIPESVTEICDGAFSGCSKLKSLSLPKKLERIPSFTFSGCAALTDVKLPHGVTVIGEFAFRGCCSLKKITIPGEVAYVGDFAFQGCGDMEEVVFLGDPDWLMDGAFEGCSKVRLVGRKDSNVERYAKENNIPFEAE